MQRPTHPAVRAAEVFARLRPRIAAHAAEYLDERDATDLLVRAERYFADSFRPLAALFGDDHDLDELCARLFEIVVDAVEARPTALRRLDRARQVDPGWFLDRTMVGYVCYADRFAETLDGVRDRIGYLEDLGVRYLHLMPLLEPREGANDGGYAVVDYTAVDPRLGSMADLEALADDLRDRRMSLCLDLVLNHVAQEHDWARRAAAGEQRYRDFFLLFDDRSEPDAYEASLPEVFPELAPGNFTWNAELDAWVWTTFHEYQWDLNHANPDVFAAILTVMLDLANRGVEVLRLDAVPFMWKRKGTDCQNQPEAHLLLQAWRGLARMAAPALTFKAEAIVSSDELTPYLGAHDSERPECDLAYHNQLMVMLWSAVAARDAVLPTVALGRMRQAPPERGWCTYVRCHDDIGWAVDDRDAAQAGVNGQAHRDFLNAFYAGDFDGTFSRGERFGANEATGDARISGTTASLAGIEAALDTGEDDLLDAAIRRHLLLHAVVFGWGGVPLLYMGDELALRNDETYRDDPALADDNRWMHRPWMDWDAAERRTEEGTLEQRVYDGIRHIVDARRATPQIEARGPVTPHWTDNTRVLAWSRAHPEYGTVLGLANLDDFPQSVGWDVVDHVGLVDPFDALGLEPNLAFRDGRVHLPALSVVWLVDR